MSYMKRYLEDICEAIHKARAKYGDVVEVESDTPTGKIRVKHTVDEADLDWHSLLYGVPRVPRVNPSDCE